jgi:predicted nucleic acid-binding protein
MPSRVLIDTGRLVALLASNDAAHRRCSDAAKQLTPPFLTSWAVMTEAAWLLRSVDQGLVRLLGLVNDGYVKCLHLEDRASAIMVSLATRYSQLRPQLADLSLVYLADREGICDVFTLDRRDFVVYRTAAGQSLRLLPDVTG